VSRKISRARNKYRYINIDILRIFKDIDILCTKEKLFKRTVAFKYIYSKYYKIHISV